MGRPFDWSCMTTVMLPASEDIRLTEVEFESFVTRLRTKRVYGSLAFYGKSEMKFPDVQEVERLTEPMFKYIKAVQSHAQHIASDVLKVLVEPFFSHPVSDFMDKVVRVKHAGIISTWSASDLGFVQFKREWVESLTDKLTVETDRYSRLQWSIIDFYSRPNPNGSLLIDAYNLARKRMLDETLRPMGWSPDVRHYTNSFKTLGGDSFIPLNEIVSLFEAQRRLSAPLKPDVQMVMRVRADLIADRALAARQADGERTQISMDNFRKYWESLKQAKHQLVQTSEVRSSFEGVPIAPEGTKSSRTWGIEVETVQAQLTSRPAGWDARHDGSLESMTASDCNYDYCECGCESCDDGDHDDCYSSDDEGSCQEFVSPILSHFNSSGLRQLCNDIGDAPCNSSPGIHVHVGAGDLSPSDVARLTRAYSIVSPFLWELTYRETTHYCKDVTSRNIAHWLSIDRNIRKKIQTNVSVSDGVYSQPDDRYHDLNTQAFNAHGTIEFRAMGPVYNYKHLIRWAWLCREMVNVSKLDLPDSLWRSVSSMADVLNIIYQYGSEISEAMVAPQLNVNELQLDSEDADEASND